MTFIRLFDEIGTLLATNWLGAYIPSALLIDEYSSHSTTVWAIPVFFSLALRIRGSKLEILTTEGSSRVTKRLVASKLDDCTISNSFSLRACVRVLESTTAEDRIQSA